MLVAAAIVALRYSLLVRFGGVGVAGAARAARWAVMGVSPGAALRRFVALGCGDDPRIGLLWP